MTRCRWLSLVASRAGTAAVDFALVLPVFILAVVGVMEAGRILWAQNLLQRAVEAAARCASINATICGSSSAVASYAATQAPGLSVPTGTFTLSVQACGNRVAASYSYPFLTTVLPLPSLTLTAQACFPT
jgi:Flp pilus assembly protein TadG